METFIVLIFCGLVFWGCWHWFLREWFDSLSITKRAKGRFAAHSIPDEDYYEMASREVRNGNLREGLWAKAWAQAEGDNTKAQALYIKLRVDSMRAEAARRFSGDNNANSQNMPAKTVVECTRCGAGLRMPTGKLLDIRCAKCGHEFRVDTAHGNTIEEYPNLKDQTIGRIGRLTFLWLWLGWAFATTVLVIVLNEGGAALPTLSPINFTTVMFAVLIYCNVVICIARLRDMDKSEWWSAITLVPFVNLALIFCLLVIPGTAGRNRFGPANIGFLNIS